jgi:hypothetical protein
MENKRDCENILELLRVMEALGLLAAAEKSVIKITLDGGSLTVVYEDVPPNPGKTRSLTVSLAAAKINPS